MYFRFFYFYALAFQSGTGVISDNSIGDYNPDYKIFDDSNVAQIESIPDSAPHRLVDVELVKADQEGEQTIK